MDTLLTLQRQDFSILGKDSILKGEFELSGMVKISSTLEGTLKMGPDGRLTIEPQGFIKGKIFCNHIEILGTFEGEIVSQGKVVIRPSARVFGQIKAKSLAIFPGACVNIDGEAHPEESINKDSGPVTPTSIQ